MASAQRETGAPVSVHAEPPGALEIQAPDVLEAGGVDPERVTIAHVDADIDPAYRAAIAARGAFVEYGFFGWGEIAATSQHVVHGDRDRERVAGVTELQDSG